MLRKLMSGGAGTDPGPAAPPPTAELGGEPAAGQSAAPANASQHSAPPPSVGCTLIQEMDKPLTAPSAILVPRVAAMQEGSQLVGDIVLGRMLGAGMQARVFELVHRDGRPTGKVVKIAHTDLGHKALNAVWISMEREWELGLKLRAALQLPDGSLPGYMRVYDAIVSRNGGKQAHFSGMILEKLNGWEVYKRIDTPEFHNIHYVREMLRSVFEALDRAQRETGFFHSDMGMRNIMENYTELYEEEERDQLMRSMKRASAKDKQAGDTAEHYETTPGALPATGEDKPPAKPATEAAMTARGGAAPVGRVEATHVPVAPGEKNVPPPFTKPEGEGGGGSVDRVRARPGWSCNADGSRMPLGPRIEFRIIDYGSSYFSETLAQATGGFKARENYDRLATMFESEHVTFKSPTKRTLVQLQTAGLKPADSEHERTWHLLPTALRQRFRLESTPVGASPLSPATSPNIAVAADEEMEVSERIHSLTLLQQGDLGTNEAAHKQLMASQSSGPARAASLPPPPTPKQGPIERMYRHFWRRKGDVFHILLNLAIVLDDRVWPSCDKEQVLLFVSLVFHVTGVKMQASFASETEPAAQSLLGRLTRVTHVRGKSELYGTKARWYGLFRRNHIRFKSHFYPFNSGLTAGEALVSPFFGREEPAPPPVGVPLGDVFPRSA